MFGGKYNIFHPRIFCGFCPCGSIEKIGIEVVEILLIIFGRYFLKTLDPLGFKETTMIQAKNRTDLSTETTVRSFYGAVCASGGSRGIFATTSDFHPSAKLFLAGIDNCVGINGEDIFNMACECLYGIRKKNGKFVIDNKVL